jgi:anti-sigma B factor antagonist
MDVFRVEQGAAPRELRLIGELDISGIDALAQAIAAAGDGAAPLTLDMSALTFMDSSGLRELLRAAREPQEQMIRLLAPSPSVRRVLEIAGVLSAFEIVEPDAASSD